MKDITKLIYSGLEVYPGDPDVCFDHYKSIQADNFELYKITLSNHTGTHIDFPSHVIKDGKNANDYDLSYLCGKGIIIDLSNCKNNQITTNHLIKKDIRVGDIVLMKHGNNINKQKKPPTLDDNAANFLLSKKIKIIGTESLSIDDEEDKNLTLHRKFLMNEVLIIECLEINELTEGRIHVFVFPLKLDSLDGLPCRVGIEYE